MFSELSELDKGFWEFFKEHEVILKDIEDAHLLPRDFSRDYSKEKVEEMLRTLDSFKGGSRGGCRKAVERKVEEEEQFRE